MKPKILLLILFVAAASATATWLAARHQPAPTASAPAIANGRKILYYQSPMHPWIKSDKPGKCPICGMDLVPVYADENGAANPSAARKIKFYQSSMNPKETSPTPAKDSMGMDMTPVYENAESTNTGFGLKLNSDSVNVANVQTVLVSAVRSSTRCAWQAHFGESWTAAWFEFTAYERDLPWLKLARLSKSSSRRSGENFTRRKSNLHGI